MQSRHFSPVVYRDMGASARILVGKKKGPIGFIVNDLPVPLKYYPLNDTNVVLRPGVPVEEVFATIQRCIGGKVNRGRGILDAICSETTHIRFTALKDPETGKIILEFNRLDGCAFVAYVEFCKAVVSGAQFFEVDKEGAIKSLLMAKEKLALWDGTSPEFAALRR